MDTDNNAKSTEMLRKMRLSMPLRIDGAKIGIGSFITFESVSTETCEKFFIWVYLCDWTLFHGDKAILSSSDRLSNGSYLECFEGRVLEQIEFDVENHNVDLIFDDDLYLLLSANTNVYDPRDELLMIYLADNNVVCYSPSRGIYFTTEDQVE